MSCFYYALSQINSNYDAWVRGVLRQFKQDNVLFALAVYFSIDTCKLQTSFIVNICLGIYREFQKKMRCKKSVTQRSFTKKALQKKRYKKTVQKKRYKKALQKKRYKKSVTK